MSIAEETKTDQEPMESEQLARKDASVWELAQIVAGSRDFPDCRTPEKAAVRILAGKEMGVGPIASVIGIRVQNGRVSMDATLMAGCIKRSPVYDYTIQQHTDQACCINFFEDGNNVGLSTFTWDDAKTANLDKKDTWKSYPRNMLFARALSNGARWYCAGIFGGSVYTHEEFGIQTDEEGRAVGTESAGGSDLCSRDQRQQIHQLVEECGDQMAAYLHSLGVLLLDELSSFEADKEIKKLEKRLAKKSGKAVAPGQPVQAEQSPPLTPAQQTLADGFEEAAKPSTARQAQRILELAEKLVPDYYQRYQALIAGVEKRGKKKISELNYLVAAAWIEELESKLFAKNANQPPFDPTPEPGK